MVFYGKLSAKYNCILDWNQFKKYFSHSKLKTLIKRQILNKYWKIYEKETFVISYSDMLCSGLGCNQLIVWIVSVLP